MKRKVWAHSLYREVFLVLLLSFTVSVLFYVISRSIFVEFNDAIWSNHEMIEMQNKRNIDRLQKHVSKNSIKSTDYEAIEDWCSGRREIFLQIIENGEVVYSSEYDADDLDQLEYIDSSIPVEPDESKLYQVNFADGTRYVYILGMYSYDGFVMGMDIIMLSSVALFVIIVLYATGKKIDYINRLSRDVAVLEGGNLDYEVKVDGRDEITSLARAINSMRISLASQRQEIDSAMETNRRMITEVSHDLRTPMTAILLYSDLIKQNKLSEEDKNIYLDKIIAKINQMKTLSDDLLDYSLDTHKPEVKSENYEPMKECFYEALSDMYTYLGAQDFDVDANIEFHDGLVCIKEEYLSRILDNVSSNILKYANPKEPVIISTQYIENYLVLCFENSILPEKGSPDTHGIGLVNIRNMMKELSGSCETIEKEGHFTLRLLFKYSQILS